MREAGRAQLLPSQDQSVPIAHRQRAQEHAVDHGKHHGRASDAQRERQRRSGCEGLGSPKPPACGADVLLQSLKHRHQPRGVKRIHAHLCPGPTPTAWQSTLTSDVEQAGAIGGWRQARRRRARRRSRPPSPDHQVRPLRGEIGNSFSPARPTAMATAASDGQQLRRPLPCRGSASAWDDPKRPCSATSRSMEQDEAFDETIGAVCLVGEWRNPPACSQHPAESDLMKSSPR